MEIPGHFSAEIDTATSSPTLTPVFNPSALPAASTTGIPVSFDLAFEITTRGRDDGPPKILFALAVGIWICILRPRESSCFQGPFGFGRLWLRFSAGNYLDTLGYNFSFGFLFDDSWNYGSYKSIGGGLAEPGASAGFNVWCLGSFDDTPATIRDFAGPFVNGSLGYGVDGLAASIDPFFDPNNLNHGVRV